MDKPTEERIEKLHPKVRRDVQKIIKTCDSLLTGRAKIRITQGLRTFAEQDALFNKKPKVTNAKGGQSVHNYGFAVDICLIIDGKEASFDTRKDWDNDKIADWDECVKVFASYGWSWGGNWNNFKDMPHFDKIGFSNWRVLVTKNKDINGYIIV